MNWLNVLNGFILALMGYSSKDPTSKGGAGSGSVMVLKTSQAGKHNMWLCSQLCNQSGM